MKCFTSLLASTILMVSCHAPQHLRKTSTMKDDGLLEKVMREYSPFLDSLFQQREALNIQVIYSSIQRSTDGAPVFTDHYMNVNPAHYFYPASTVKLPVALLALQRLNELNIPGLDKNTIMLTGAEGDGQTAVTADTSAANGMPSVAQYIRKILLVSDNDAFNRLYEFLGPTYINEHLHAMGYEDVQLIHRLSITLTEAQNRATNPIRFVDASGKTVYEQPAQVSDMKYTKRNDLLGNGYMKDTVLVNEPFDFSKKNRIALNDLHRILKAALFPAQVEPRQRFNLTEDDYSFLRKYMSMVPPQSDHPAYDPAVFPATYVKHWIYGSSGPLREGLQILNKTGTAYGYLLDIAYIRDTARHIEFMLSGVIYSNSDGIFNDDKYDYDKIGYPFFREMGEAMYEYEKKRL